MYIGATVPRYLAALSLFFAALPASALDDRDFNGHWIFKPEKSELKALPHPPDPVVTIEQHVENGIPLIHWFAVDGGQPRETWTYRTDTTSLRHNEGGNLTSSQAKWEGSALLIETIVSLPNDNYSIADRWKLSRDGNRLTIVRQIVRRSAQVESTLVYEREGFVPSTPPALVTRTETRPNEPLTAPEDYLVQQGTHLPLRLLNSVSSKHSSPGDRIYLQTIYPISSQGRIVIPAGSYVTGSLTEVKRAGRVKGRSELYLRFDSLTLPNGTTRDFRARISGMDDNGKGSVDPKEEGKVQGESGKGTDARTVATATAVGTGIGAAAGSAAGHLGMGAGIGAAAGAVGGLAGVLLTRGPDAVLDKGSTVEMVLDRDLKFTRDELATHRDR